MESFWQSSLIDQKTRFLSVILTVSRPYLVLSHLAGDLGLKLMSSTVPYKYRTAVPWLAAIISPQPKSIHEVNISGRNTSQSHKSSSQASGREGSGQEIFRQETSQVELVRGGIIPAIAGTSSAKMTPNSPWNIVTISVPPTKQSFIGMIYPYTLKRQLI